MTLRQIISSCKSTISRPTFYIVIGIFIVVTTIIIIIIMVNVIIVFILHYLSSHTAVARLSNAGKRLIRPIRQDVYCILQIMCTKYFFFIMVLGSEEGSSNPHRSDDLRAS